MMLKNYCSTNVDDAPTNRDETKFHLRKGPHVPAELQQASGQSSSEEHGLPGEKIQNHKITIDR